MKNAPKTYSEGQVVAILEDIKDQFVAFGEGQSLVSEGQERLEKKVDGIDQRLMRVEAVVEGIDVRLVRMEDDVVEIKHKFSEKVDLADFQKLEKRLVKLERLVLAAR